MAITFEIGCTHTFTLSWTEFQWDKRLLVVLFLMICGLLYFVHVFLSIKIFISSALLFCNNIGVGHHSKQIPTA